MHDQASGPEEPSVEAAAPRRFGPYELLGEVGRGGTGVIYRVRQPGLERVIALKMLVAGEFADEAARKRLLREARVVARLSHPNIVTIHEVGEYDGRPFLAMEYVSGGNLAQAAAGRPLPIAKAAEYVQQLARAVDYAHRQGVIHRDLKPANVLVDGRGEVKLTDFGLTKLVMDLSQTMESAGSPNFMSPEQASSELGATGPHTDVFGLGAILYYLLTGQPPFDGKMLAETLRAVVDTEPAEPRALRPDIPPDLETICLKCLRKLPAERYGSALELAEDLERFLRWEPVRARRIGLAGRTIRWVYRNPALTGLLAISILALIAVSWQWRRSVAGEYAARRNAYAAQMLLAQQRYETFNPGGALALLNEVIPKAGELDLRGFEWAYLYRLCHQEERIIPVDEKDVNFIAFAPSGKYFLASVAHSLGSQLQLFDATNGHKLRTFCPEAMHFAFSPDGALVASVHGTNSIVIHQFPNGDEVRTIKGHSGWVKCLAFSPDGRMLASGGTDQRVRLWNVADGKLVHDLTANTNRGVFCVAWDRAGSRIFAGGDDGLIYSFDAVTGRQLSILHGHEQYVYQLALSPDGRVLASSSGDGRILLWEAASGQQRTELRGHSSTVYGIAFSPDGRQLASASWDNTARIWNLDRRGAARILRGSRSFAYSVAYSPDGKILASGGHDGTIRMWRPQSDPTQIVLGGADQEVLGISWGASGRWLSTLEAVNATETMQRVWDVSTAQQIGACRMRSARLFLDGDRILFQNPDDTMAFFEPETLARTALPTRFKALLSFQVSPDGKRFGTAEADGEARLWATLDQPPLRSISIPRPGTNNGDGGIQFSPDSRWFIANGPDSNIHVWDARNGREQVSYPRPYFPQGVLQVSPNSELIAALDGAHHCVWELGTGKQRLITSYHENQFAPGPFSRDSRTILAGHGAVFDLWDTETGRLRLSLNGHYGRVLCATYSPDGRRIATAGDDHTIKIWDSEDGRELLSITGHESETYCLAFSPDGRRLASSGRDQTVRIWTAATVDQIAEWERQDRHLTANGPQRY